MGKIARACSIICSVFERSPVVPGTGFAHGEAGCTLSRVGKRARTFE